MKKPIVIGSSILVLILCGVGAFLFRSKIMPVKNQVEVEPIMKEVQKELVVWEDPAGFSFQYPKELQVNKHDEDLENYAHVELTSLTHPGMIIVWAKDALHQNVSSWIKNDTALTAGTSVDTTLGGKEAKKIIIPGTAKKLITGAIDDEILFTIEADPIDEVFWEEVYQGIIQTFAFTPIEEEASESDTSSIEDASSYDEEEVLE